jgi:hypothetical protein
VVLADVRQAGLKASHGCQRPIPERSLLGFIQSVVYQLADHRGHWPIPRLGPMRDLGKLLVGELDLQPSHVRDGSTRLKDAMIPRASVHISECTEARSGPRFILGRRLGLGQRAGPRWSISAFRSATIARTTVAGIRSVGANWIVPLAALRCLNSSAWAAWTAGLIG